MLDKQIIKMDGLGITLSSWFLPEQQRNVSDPQHIVMQSRFCNSTVDSSDLRLGPHGLLRTSTVEVDQYLRLGLTAHVFHVSLCENKGYTFF